MTTFSPKRPYFIRAMHEWLNDNELTPYLMVDAAHPDLVAPIEYAQDGRLVLNASYTATHNLHIDNDAISFSARFGGVSQDLWLPMAAVLGIFAKEEQSHALFFDPNEYKDVDTTHSTTDNKDPSQKANPLKIIK